MPAEPLHLLLRGQPRRRLAGRVDVRGGQQGHVKDGGEVSHHHLHHQRLVRVVDQGGQGHLGVRLPRLDQRGAEDDAQVARRHLVLLGLLGHSAVIKSRCTCHR